MASTGSPFGRLIQNPVGNVKNTMYAGQGGNGGNVDDYRTVHKGETAGPETRTVYVNIDSRFKNNPRDSDTKFTVNLIDPLRNVTKVRVASVEFPNVPYVISEYTGTNSVGFTLSDSSSFVVTVPDGNYDLSDLLDTVNSGLIAGVSGVEFLYDEAIRRVRLGISNDDLSAFNTAPTGRFADRDADWGLGYILGFRERFYTITGQDISNDLVAEAPPCITGPTYYLLQVNGFDTVQSPAQNHTVAAAAKLLTGGQGEFGHVPGGSAVTVFQDGRNLLSFLHEEQTPVDFARVEIRVVDAYGEEIQPFYKPMSLTLEITNIMQSQLYEQQRNRMFQMSQS